VLEARERQQRRLEGTSAACNGQMDSAIVRRSVAVAPRAAAALHQAYERGDLSARGHHRVLRVAQTVVDLRGGTRVEQGDLLAALGLRQRQADAAVAA